MVVLDMTTIGMRPSALKAVAAATVGGFNGEMTMTRARAWLLRAAVVASVVGLAACDAPSAVSGPRPQASARTTGGTSTMTMTTTSTASDTTGTCRSGYQIAYRSDGSTYCVPMDQ